VPARGRDLTRAFQAKCEPEVGVIVAGIDLQRGLELRPGEPEPAGTVVRAGERLADRPLVRFLRARVFEHDRGLVASALGEEGQTFL